MSFSWQGAFKQRQQRYRQWCRQEESSADGRQAGRLASRPYVSQSLPHHVEEAYSLSAPCTPGLEPAHMSLHPWQEAEALVGDADAEASVQGLQGLGALLGPALLQLLPARLPQQYLGAEVWAGGRPTVWVGTTCPSPEASASFQATRSPGVPGTPSPLRLPTTWKDHQILRGSQNASPACQPSLPLCRHTPPTWVAPR